MRWHDIILDLMWLNEMTWCYMRWDEMALMWCDDMILDELRWDDLILDEMRWDDMILDVMRWDDMTWY